MTKACFTCGAVRPLEEFCVDRRRSDGRRGSCRPCTRAADCRYRAQRRARDPEGYSAKLRRSNLRNAYGITPEHYDEMFERQGGRCAICEKPKTPKRRLAVDHDHKTGKVRALLCTRCNPAIGYFLDDPQLLARAAVYLHEWSEQ